MLKNKDNVKALGDDKEHVYELDRASNYDGSHVKQKKDGTISIGCPSLELGFHEMGHVRQSLDSGFFQFNSDGLLLNSSEGMIATDQDGMKEKFQKSADNEIESYKLQYAYNPDNMPQKVNSLSEITEEYVANLQIDGIFLYPRVKALVDNKHNK